ncbi:MAG: hypothetical protein ACNFW9_01630 [Candidatus Kerfeldbacteria bacterium]|jgi:hypothetical protein
MNSIWEVVKGFISSIIVPYIGIWTIEGTLEGTICIYKLPIYMVTGTGVCILILFICFIIHVVIEEICEKINNKLHQSI